MVSVGLTFALAALLFGVVVRRARRDDPERAATKAITCALLALPALALLFLGVPFPLAARSRARPPRA